MAISQYEREANRSVTLRVGDLSWASSDEVIDAVLSRRPGVLGVVAKAVTGTATVTYDPDVTSVAGLTGWVRDCGFHCAGGSVPEHICDPLAEPGPPDAHDSHVAGEHAAHPVARPAEAPLSSHEVMGHGGHHAGASMADMVTDMRNRFLVAAMLSVPILLYSAIGREVLGFTAPAPFGLRDDVFALLLSLPVMAYSAWIFFDGAYRALRARTLDMMVLVAVGVGAGWLYSLGVTLTGGGEVFYEAATVLAAFVLLGTLVRDAGPRRGQRRHPHPLGARPSDGRGAA